MVDKPTGEELVTISFTLSKDIVSWIERTAGSKDLNKSQLARKIFRAAMAGELTKLVKAKKVSK